MSRPAETWECPVCGAHVGTAVPLVGAPRHHCPRRAGRVAELVRQHADAIAASHAEIEQAFRALPVAAQEAVVRLASFGILPPERSMA